MQDTEEKTSALVTGIGTADTIQIVPSEIYQITKIMHSLPSQKKSVQVTL